MTTTYYAVYCLNQTDLRPVIIARYEELATGFAQQAFGDSVPYVVKPLVLRDELIVREAQTPSASSSPGTPGG